MAAPSGSSRTAASWAVTPGDLPPAGRGRAGWQQRHSFGGRSCPGLSRLWAAAGPFSFPSRGPGCPQPALPSFAPSLQPAVDSRNPLVAPKWRRPAPSCLGPRGPVPGDRLALTHPPLPPPPPPQPRSRSLRSGTARPLLPTPLRLLPARVGGAHDPIGGAAAATHSAPAHPPGTPSPRSAVAVGCVDSRARGMVGAACCGAASGQPRAATATRHPSSPQSPGCEDELCQTPTQK